MRKILFLLFYLISFKAFSQQGYQGNYYYTGSVSIGTGQRDVFPDASAWSSWGKDTTKRGLLFPKVNLDSVSTTKRGLYVYDLKDSVLYHFDGTKRVRYMTYKDTSLIISLIQNYAPVTPETDPVWTAASSNYYNKTQSDLRYLQSYTETDPIFIASPSFGISSTDITHWNTAYGWGNHASAGYELQSNKATSFATQNNTLYPSVLAVETEILSKGYITANQTITLSGDVSGSGTTAITTTIGAGKVTNTMLLNSTISGVSLGGTLFSHSASTGLTGTAYNGSAAVSWTNDLSTGIASAIQDVYGSTLSGGSLRLNSTTNSTKGFIYIGVAGALSSAYDANTKRLGIGTYIPSLKLSVIDSGSNIAVAYFQNSHVGGYSSGLYYNNAAVQKLNLGYANASASDASVQGKAFLSTASSVDFVFSNNGTSSGAFKSDGKFVFGATSSTPNLSVNIVSATSGVAPMSIQNTSSGGYSSSNHYDNSSTFKLGVGYANSSAADASVAGTAYFYSGSSVDFRWVCNGTRLMTLFSGGNLAINNTTNAGFKLDVQGTVNFNGGGTLTGGDFSIGSTGFINYNNVSGISAGDIAYLDGVNRIKFLSSTIHLDLTNSRLGVFNQSPTYHLDVWGTSSASTGRGVMAQMTDLRTTGNFLFAGYSAVSQGQNFSFLTMATNSFPPFSSVDGGYIRNTISGSPIFITTNNAGTEGKHTTFFANGNGGVGIANTDGGFKWDVNGSGRFQTTLTIGTTLTLDGATGKTIIYTNNTTAPSTNIGVGIVNYYGTSATNFLGDPVKWIIVKIGGTEYKVPAY